jgi:quinoprotein glucose dehydrogenase
VAAVVQLARRDTFDGRMEDGWEHAAMRGTPYLMRRRILLSPAGVPCTPPPFGSLVAVNVETGTIAWRVPLGTPGPLAPTRSDTTRVAARPSAFRQAFGARGPAGADSLALRALGSPNLGGPIVTAGGLVFIGATLDHRIRAFDVDSGRELWQGALPAGAKATPMTYAAQGRQFVAIAAGGDGNVFGRGDEIVVFALPRP